jgi:branched-chain amino acid transport system substrate-binding protein
LRNLLLSTAAAAVLTIGLSTAASAQIKVGMAGPLTGSNAAFGEQQKTGADLAVADINAAGGVLGKQLDLVTIDDACDPKTAVSAANTLVSDGVVMVDGHFCSASSIPAGKVYADNGILQISPASTNPKYTDEGSPTTFRVCGRDDQQGKVAAEYIKHHFASDKIAVLDDNSTYGKGIADEVRKNMAALGVPVAYSTSYTAGDKDYSALISRMKQDGIQLVYIGGYYSDSGLIMREGAQQGFTPQYFSEDAAATSALWQIAGSAAEGALLTFPPPAEQDPAAAKVVAQLKAKGAVFLRRHPGLGGSRQEGAQHQRRESRGRTEVRWPLEDGPWAPEVRQQGRRRQRRLRDLQMARRQLHRLFHEALTPHTSPSPRGEGRGGGLV